MKPMSVLAVCAASVAILASAACKKDEPASETNTTSAPITPDQPVVTPQTPTVAPGTDLNATPQQTTTGTIQNGQSNAKSPTPTGGTDLIDRGNTDMNQSQPITPPDQTQKAPSQQLNNGQAVPNNQQPNHSTPLGDGKSGTYTDNKGTHGGKATWGTGTPGKSTDMDKPTK